MADDLESIRARANLAAPDLAKVFHKESEIRPVRASARDVPTLLALLDSLTPLVVAARAVAYDQSDDTALVGLIEAIDKMPYSTLDALKVD